MADTELPLFPLNVVLFPEMMLPLHVFEPHYVEMIESCLAGDGRFGVVLVAEAAEGEPQEPCLTGTVAVIREHNKIVEGRYMLLAVGERRFQIDELRRDGERLFATVDYLDDDPDTAAGLEDVVGEVRGYALEQLRLAREAMGRLPGETELPSDPKTLSFVLASHVDMTLTERQALLEMTDTKARIEILRSRLRHQVAKLTHRREIQETAERIRGGNGRLGNDHLDRSVLEQFED